MAPQKKMPMNNAAAFLGENSALVNLDNLIKPMNNATNNNAYNPFESPALKTKNLFQQNQPQVSFSQGKFLMRKFDFPVCFRTRP